MVERADPFAFVAPSDGYISKFEQAMPPGSGRWTSSIKKDLFLELSDGSFARVSLHLVAGGDHFIYLDSYMGRTPGNKNLEFDPNKVVTLQPR